MNLTDSQRAAVTGWIAEGLKLSEVQSRLGKEFNLSLTYMEVRFLVDDLKLVPKDPPAPVAGPNPSPALQTNPAPGATQSEPAGAAPETVGAEPAAAPAPPGGVKLSVDKVTRPGAFVSGSVTFSDGMKAAWYLDQMGRLGIVADKKGYKPSQADVQQFQIAVQAEMVKLGY
ncbi:MAG: hypothetical protein FJ386_07970 [Verrucomicrobia bacterium]|nr:hypothetical protein [Verrucomicrobiota bacterium]